MPLHCIEYAVLPFGPTKGLGVMLAHAVSASMEPVVITILEIVVNFAMSVLSINGA